MAARDFCTITNQPFIARALTLYNSLVRHAQPFRLFVLCMDEVTLAVLSDLNLPGIHPIPLAEIERADEDLRRVHTERPERDYCYTCKPALAAYVFKAIPDVTTLISLDADTYFFESPQALLDDMGEASVLITEHRFQTPGLSEKYGRFNSGIFAIRRTDEGLACLHRWREQCIEWCHNRHEDGRFTDQKYMDAWPGRVPGVKVCDLIGVNLSWWNVENRQVHRTGGTVLVDGSPVICFHFNQTRAIRSFLFDTKLRRSGRSTWSGTPDCIYRPYLIELRDWIRRLGKRVCTPDPSLAPPGWIDVARMGGLQVVVGHWGREIYLPRTARLLEPVRKPLREARDFVRARR